MVGQGGEGMDGLMRRCMRVEGKRVSYFAFCFAGKGVRGRDGGRGELCDNFLIV